MWYVIYTATIHGPFETRNQAIVYSAKRQAATGLSGSVVADSWAQQHALSMVLVKPDSSFTS